MCDERLQIGDQWSLEWESKGVKIFGGEYGGGWYNNLWVHKSCLSPCQLLLDSLSDYSSKSSVYLLSSVHFVLPSYNSLWSTWIHFYQPSNKTRWPDKQRSAASDFKARNFNKERDNSVAYEPSSGRLKDYDLIEYIDLTASPLEDSFHSSPAPVLGPKNAELHTGGTSRRL